MIARGSSILLVVTTLSALCGSLALAQCPAPMEVVAGAPDEFMLPVEPSYPSARLLDYTSRFWPQRTVRLFDTVGIDIALVHTFTGWQGRVCGAALEIRLRCGPDPLSTNDSIRLGLKGGSDHQRAFRYWVTIRRVLGSWEPGDESTLTLDLADLPVYGGFPTNILSSLNDGELELLVEDDTEVDYAILRVCKCGSLSQGPADVNIGPDAGPAPARPTTWGRLKATYPSDSASS